MKIYSLTDIGDSEAASPASTPSDAQRVLYYLRKRANRTASDDMISTSIFSGDKFRASRAIGRCMIARAVKQLGG